MGTVDSIVQEKSNLIFKIRSVLAPELKIDQSLSHNGVCLTVTDLDLENGLHSVTAIAETLSKTQLADWKVGDHINLERCLQLNGRLDGHMVQGHVDTVATCTELKEMGGSWVLRFQYPAAEGHLTVEKGSICVNGVSLTVVESSVDSFSVAIIPFTWQHTNFQYLKPGVKVNLEFDIIGKYIRKYLMAQTAGMLQQS